MSFILNVNKNVPTENETRKKILIISQGRGCYREAKAIFEKYDKYLEKYYNDERAKYQMVYNMLRELGNIDVYLVAWLADEEGKIRINGELAFELVDVPDDKIG